MGITVCHRSALELLRTARVEAGKEGLSLTNTDLLPPSLEAGESWSALAVSRLKQDLGLPESKPLDILVPNAASRIRVPGVVNHVWGTKVSGLRFWETGHKGVIIPTPEVLLAQMAEVASLPELVALGHELCGGYTLRPSGSPSSAFTGVPEVTSEAEIRNLYKSARGLRGHGALRFALPRIRDGSVSPQETCLSTMLQLPTEHFGYQMGWVDLNRTVRPRAGLEGLTKATHRVPDILFRHTKVGINYDGDGHADLDAIVVAERKLAAEPKSAELQTALEDALRSARTGISADKQRDRDLMAMGYAVLPVTKFDLESIDGLDLVVRQAIALIERTTGRDMRLQKQALGNDTLKEGRAQLLRVLRNL